jgi:hypothetical protein
VRPAFYIVSGNSILIVLLACRFVFFRNDNNSDEVYGLWFHDANEQSSAKTLMSTLNNSTSNSGTKSISEAKKENSNNRNSRKTATGNSNSPTRKKRPRKTAQKTAGKSQLALLPPEYFGFKEEKEGSSGGSKGGAMSKAQLKAFLHSVIDDPAIFSQLYAKYLNFC